LHVDGWAVFDLFDRASRLVHLDMAAGPLFAFAFLFSCTVPSINRCLFGEVLNSFQKKGNSTLIFFSRTNFTCISLRRRVLKEQLTQRNYEWTHSAGYKTTEKVARNLSDKQNRKNSGRGDPSITTLSD
jgi:hypothetical protein